MLSHWGTRMRCAPPGRRCLVLARTCQVGWHNQGDNVEGRVWMKQGDCARSHMCIIGRGSRDLVRRLTLGIGRREAEGDFFCCPSLAAASPQVRSPQRGPRRLGDFPHDAGHCVFPPCVHPLDSRAEGGRRTGHGCFPVARTPLPELEWKHRHPARNVSTRVSQQDLFAQRPPRQRPPPTRILDNRPG